MLALIALLSFLTVYPLAMLLYGSLHSTPPGMAGTFNLDGYAQIFTTSNVLVLANTVGISFAKTIPSILLAVALAFILARTDTPARGALEVLVTLPFFIPPILTAMAWGMLGNPQVGVLNLVWKSLTGATTSPINVYSYGGVVWHMMQYSTPFLFLFIVDAFRAMDPTLEESSRMCGASRWHTFRRITLILMLPAIVSSFALSLIRGIELFESPLFFGLPAGITVITTEIYNAINHRATPAYQYATALSFAIMVFMFLFVVWQWRVLHGRSFATVTGKAYAPNVMKLGPLALGDVRLLRPVLRHHGGAAGRPVADRLVLQVFRLLRMGHADARALRGGLGEQGVLARVQQHHAARRDRRFRHHDARRRRRLRDGAHALARAPPDRRAGLAAVDDARHGARRRLPVGVRHAAGTDPDLRHDLGAPASPTWRSERRSRCGSCRTPITSSRSTWRNARGCTAGSWWQTLWRILIALSWPSFAVGWVLTFFGIMRELSASILLYSVGSEVLSVVLLKLWSNGQAEQVSVIGLLMMLLVIFFRFVQLKVIKQRISTL